MHSVVTNATWSSDRPVTSKIGETTFKHEFSCVLTRGTGVDPHECDCYVSGVRLVETPVGDWLPTTEPDPQIVFQEYRQVKCALAVLASAVTAVAVIQAIVLAVGA